MLVGSARVTRVRMHSPHRCTSPVTPRRSKARPGPKGIATLLSRQHSALTAHIVATEVTSRNRRGCPPSHTRRRRAAAKATTHTPPTHARSSARTRAREYTASHRRPSPTLNHTKPNRQSAYSTLSRARQDHASPLYWAGGRVTPDERRSDARRIAVKVDLDQLRRRKPTNRRPRAAGWPSLRRRAARG